MTDFGVYRPYLKIITLNNVIMYQAMSVEYKMKVK